MGILLTAAGETFVSFESEAEGMAGCGRGLRKRRMCAGRNKGLEGEMRGSWEGKRVNHCGKVGKIKRKKGSWEKLEWLMSPPTVTN